jgi:hypothetical protein
MTLFHEDTKITKTHEVMLYYNAFFVCFVSFVPS